MKITVWKTCSWGYEVLPRLWVAYEQKPHWMAPALYIVVEWLRWGRTIRVTLWN